MVLQIFVYLCIERLRILDSKNINQKTEIDEKVL